MGLKHLVPLGARNFLRPTYQWVCRGMQKTRQSHASWKQFRKDYQEFVFRQERIRPEQPALWNERYPCLNDRTAATGFDRHYVYHTAWAARVLSETCPEMHYDISSCLYFIGVLSAFVPVRFWDYRPAALKLSSL